MQNKIYLALGLVILVLILCLAAANFLIGRETVKIGDEKQQVRVLVNDAHSVAKIDKQETVRHAKDEAIVKQAVVEIPTDDFNRPISADAVKRLCDLGADCSGS